MMAWFVDNLDILRLMMRWLIVEWKRMHMTDGKPRDITVV